MLIVPMATRSKARMVFDRLDTGIVGSNPARGMDVCVCARATGWSPIQGVLSRVDNIRYFIINSETVMDTWPRP